MDVQFYGANCMVIHTSNARVVIDDNLAELGGKSVGKVGDVALFTTTQAKTTAKDAKLRIDMPGEYEASDVSIYGIPARAHVDEDKQRTATMYKIIARDIRVLVTGHIFPRLSENELENIGTIDVMIVPVGGNGFTLDPTGAMELVKEIEPKLVIPTYYEDPDLKFPVPAQTLEQALHTMGIEPRERVSKLRIKPAEFSDAMQLVVLEKSKN